MVTGPINQGEDWESFDKLPEGVVQPERYAKEYAALAVVDAHEATTSADKDAADLAEFEAFKASQKVTVTTTDGQITSGTEPYKGVA